MQAEPRSWREILGQAIEDRNEKKRIAQELNIDARTLDRWANGANSPRIYQLKPLIDALPKYRYSLIRLLSEEFPEVAERLEMTSEMVVDETVPDIVSFFYERTLQERTHAFSPLTQWGMCTLLLQQFVAQLDSDKKGVAAFLVQCVAPDADQKVQTLHEQYSEYSAAWTAKRAKYYVGAESLAGNVVSSAQPMVYNDAKQEHVALLYHSDAANSVMAYPLLLYGRIAGCLLVFSTQQDFFTHVRFDLVRKYSNLLTLAIRESDFYALEDIELHLMPEAGIQLVYLSMLNEKVYEEMSRAEQSGTPLTRKQAEKVVLQQFLEGNG